MICLQLNFNYFTLITFDGHVEKTCCLHKGFTLFHKKNARKGRKLILSKPIWRQKNTQWTFGFCEPNRLMVEGNSDIEEWKRGSVRERSIEESWWQWTRTEYPININWMRIVQINTQLTIHEWLIWFWHSILVCIVCLLVRTHNWVNKLTLSSDNGKFN